MVIWAETAINHITQFIDDENEPLGQQKTYLQKYLQNKGFTDFGKSFF